MCAHHEMAPCKNGCTDRDAIWHVAWVGPSNHVLDGGPDPPREMGMPTVGIFNNMMRHFIELPQYLVGVVVDNRT